MSAFVSVCACMFVWSPLAILKMTTIHSPKATSLTGPCIVKKCLMVVFGARVRGRIRISSGLVVIDQTTP